MFISEKKPNINWTQEDTLTKERLVKKYNQNRFIEITKNLPKKMMNFSQEKQKITTSIW